MELAPVGEPKLAADHEVTNGARDEDLAWPCLAHDPSRQMHGQAADVVAADLDLAGMDAASDLERLRLGGGDDLPGASNRLGGSAEGCEHAISQRLDGLAAVLLDG